MEIIAITLGLFSVAFALSFLLRKLLNRTTLRNSQIRPLTSRLSLIITLAAILLSFESYKKQAQSIVVPITIPDIIEPIQDYIEQEPEPPKVIPREETPPPVQEDKIEEVKEDVKEVKVNVPEPVESVPLQPVTKAVKVKAPVKTKEPKQEPIIVAKPKPTIVIPDVNPEYPGGLNALRKEVSRKYNVPQKLLRQGKGGRVVVKFEVNTKGEVGEIHILKGIENCEQCSEEARKVLKSLKKKFKPGEVQGQAVRAWYVLPIQLNIK